VYILIRGHIYSAIYEDTGVGHIYSSIYEDTGHISSSIWGHIYSSSSSRRGVLYIQ
jgi:hypothetical protein